MRLGRARARRGAIADGGAAGDQARLVGLFAPLPGGEDGLGVMAVDAHGVPAAGLETLDLVDESATDSGPSMEMPLSSQSTMSRFSLNGRRWRWLPATRLPSGRRRTPAHRYGDRPSSPNSAASMRSARAMPTEVARPWPERAGGHFDAGVWPYSGWPGVFEPDLAEIPDVLQRHALFAGEMEQGVEQHGAVAGGEHETVAVRPMRIGGVVFQHFGEQAPWRRRPRPSAGRDGPTWPFRPRPSRAPGWRWPSRMGH